LDDTEYAFAGWSNGPETPQQTFVMPATNVSLTAHFVPIGPCVRPGNLITDGLVLQLESDLNVSLQTDDIVAGWLDQSGLGNDLVAIGNPRLVPNATPTLRPAIQLDGD